MNKEIRGKKVILREQREEDAAFFSYWFNQPEIMFQCGFTDFTDEEKEKKPSMYPTDPKIRSGSPLPIRTEKSSEKPGSCVCFRHGIRRICRLSFQILKCRIKDTVRKRYISFLTWLSENLI